MPSRARSIIHRPRRAVPLHPRPSLALRRWLTPGGDQIQIDAGRAVFGVDQIESVPFLEMSHADGRPLSRRTGCERPRSRRRHKARQSAMKPPVIEAVRVPPSASSTSQSIVIVRSPS